MILPCPFCGGEGQLSADHDPTWMWAARITCEHCAAQGSECDGHETQAEAEESAIKNWNEAGRPGWWERTVARRWRTLRNDVREFVTGGYDRRAVMRSMWKGIRR